VDLFYRYPVSVVVIEFLLIGLVRWNVDLVFRSASGSLQICRAADGGICLLGRNGYILITYLKTYAFGTALETST